MDRNTYKELKAAYLQKHLFSQLKNLNDGFDSPTISYFTATEFEKVLNSVKELGLGIYGIEPWLNGEYYSVATFEEFGTNPSEPDWYFTAFSKFQSSHPDLQYSASYHVPEEILIRELKKE